MAKCPNCHSRFVEEGELCDNCQAKEDAAPKTDEPEDEDTEHKSKKRKK